jgi:thioesterase domain-containing protein
MAYSQLGELIDRPLYGIQAEPRDFAHRPLDIPALGREYASELRQHRSKGPYSIGGWSSGAMIAFEMAARIEAAGERVKQVFILDGPTPNIHCEVRDENLLLWFLQDLALGFPTEQFDLQAFAGMKADEQLRNAAALLDSSGKFGLNAEALTASFQIFRNVVIAGASYRPKSIASDVTVVRVEEDIVDEFSTHPSRKESDWGWSRFTGGKVWRIRVPGTHHTFLKRPLVETWCGLLNEAKPVFAGRA